MKAKISYASPWNMVWFIPFAVIGYGAMVGVYGFFILPIAIFIGIYREVFYRDKVLAIKKNNEMFRKMFIVKVKR